MSAKGALSRQTIYRVVTRVQIVSSCVSLLILCIALPIMYNGVQQTVDYVHKEMTFCEVGCSRVFALAD